MQCIVYTSEVSVSLHLCVCVCGGGGGGGGGGIVEVRFWQSSEFKTSMLPMYCLYISWWARPSAGN